MTTAIDQQSMHAARLDHILKSAVVWSWGEVMPDLATGLIHVEYQTGGDGTLSFIKVWASIVRGEWKLVCELWMQPLWSHVDGVRFGAGFHSLEFARTLELVVGNDHTAMQPNLHGLIQAFPPTATERSDAEVAIREAVDQQDATITDLHPAA